MAKTSKKPAGRRLTAKTARHTALAGDTDTALTALRGFADAGDVAASASIAELLAFQGAWAELVPHAAKLTANPSAVYAANVFDDMVRLLGRAGHETGDWAGIAAAIAPAIAAAKAEQLPPNVPRRHEVILTGLAAYCARRGAPPHELVSLWQSASQEQTPPERRKSYEDARDNVFTHRPKLKDKPEHLARHLFSLAVSFEQPDEIARIYPLHEELRDFADACEVAQVVAPTDAQRAWAALEKKLSSWYPVDLAQVAPVVLLTEPTLRPLLGPERCALVLRTPRSGQR